MQNQFFDLPKCNFFFQAVLSAIILVALKSMLMQFHDLPKYWSISKLDGALWVFVFSATIVLNVDSGLLLGIGFALCLLVYRYYFTSFS